MLNPYKNPVMKYCIFDSIDFFLTPLVNIVHLCNRSTDLDENSIERTTLVFSSNNLAGKVGRHQRRLCGQMTDLWIT